MFHNGRARHKSLDQNFNDRQIRSCLFIIRPYLLISLEFYCHRFSAFQLSPGIFISESLTIIRFLGAQINFLH